MFTEWATLHTYIANASISALGSVKGNKKDANESLSLHQTFPWQNTSKTVSNRQMIHFYQYTIPPLDEKNSEHDTK